MWKRDGVVASGWARFVPASVGFRAEMRWRLASYGAEMKLLQNGGGCRVGLGAMGAMGAMGEVQCGASVPISIFFSCEIVLHISSDHGNERIGRGRKEKERTK